MELFKKIAESIHSNQSRNAFLIGGEYYTYEIFAQLISNIRKEIEFNIAENETIVGLIQNDDIETYASIIALWLEGKAYLPLSDKFPVERNLNIIQQTELGTVLGSSFDQDMGSLNYLNTKQIRNSPINLIPIDTDSNKLAYVLFTSGTTGQPKGVPISRHNLSSFIDSSLKIENNYSSNDRFLQMFDLTFDLSIWSYVLPLLYGACVYTIPKDKMKYIYLYDLIEDYKLTVALMVPSILHFLRPHFDEIDAPSLRLCFFCGEALPLDLVIEWGNCVPNSKLLNVYGPTENTIYCTSYEIQRTSKVKNYNGIVSIGRKMQGIEVMIIDQNNNELKNGNTGELCLSGEQLTLSYWKNPIQDKNSFFTRFNQRGLEKYYKTGDLCEIDEEGDIMYIGRLDSQVQIQGFRVELSEIEFHAKSFLSRANVAVITFPDLNNNIVIGLAIESEWTDSAELISFMKLKLPIYMVPNKILFYDSFPLNINGKTDKNSIVQDFNNNKKKN